MEKIRHRVLFKRSSLFSAALVVVLLGHLVACTRFETRNGGNRQTSLLLTTSRTEAPSKRTTNAVFEPRSPATESSIVRVSIELQAQLVAEDAGTPPCHVLAIGDSLTDPQSQGGGYLKGWRTRCPDCRFTNIGRGGAMVNQMLWRLRKHLSESTDRYTHWVIFGGVNDLYSNISANRSLEKIERDLTDVYKLGRAHGSTVIAITVAPWGGFRRWYTEERGSNTKSLNEWIAQAQKRGIIDIVVDSGASLSCSDPMQLCPGVMAPYRDGLHFGPEGHRRLGESLILALDGAACRAGVSR